MQTYVASIPGASRSFPLQRMSVRAWALLCLLVLAVSASWVRAQEKPSPSDALDKALEQAEQKSTAPQAVQRGQQQSLPPPASPQDALDRALQEAEKAEVPTLPGPPAGAPQPASSDVLSRPIGNVTLRLIDISFDGLFAAGTSTATNEELQDLEAGGHDPRWRGFTLQNVELSFQGAVDPYFLGEAHIVFFIDPSSGDSEFELEEAFLTTLALPWGLQVKGGLFNTEFGRINVQHPHQWDWLDAPVVNTRFFGPDGLRGVGFRIGWLTPLPWYSQFLAGMENANGEGMSSFLSNKGLYEERPFDSRPFVQRDVKTFEDLAYLLRWENGFDITDEIGTKAGLSLAYGPNCTGPEGYTRITGVDAVVKWRPLTTVRGWPFVIWQSEVMVRNYFADSYENLTDPANPIVLHAKMFHDWGLYTQVLWGFDPGWAAGIRYEFAGPDGDSADPQDDPFRDSRHRVAPLLVWQPTEFSRLRVQFNYEHAQHLDPHEAYSIWFGAEIMLGAHAAHSY